jgi:putative transposase
MANAGEPWRTPTSATSDGLKSPPKPRSFVGMTCASSLPAVSPPRRIVPGATYLITRRCYQRTFRLRPSPTTNAIFAYCLALALRKTGVTLHAGCVMSDHHHLVVTDVRGVLPDFLRELHRSTAKAINASQGQWENLWSAEQTSVVRLATDQDIIAKIAYVVTNPVQVGLVERPGDWPGLILWGDSLQNVARPGEYFDSLGRAPETIELRVVSPPLSNRSAIPLPEWRQRLTRAITDQVAEARRLLRAAGLDFLGRDAVLAQSFVRRAQSHEQKRQMVPRVAAKDPFVRRMLLRADRAFYAAYRAALEKWRQGLRLIRFPFGTWWMRVHHRVCLDVEPAPA